MPYNKNLISKTCWNNINDAFNLLYSFQYQDAYVAFCTFEAIYYRQQLKEPMYLSKLCYGKAKSLEELTRYKEAINLYESNIEKFDDAHQYYGLIQCYIRINKLELAKKYLSIALKKFNDPKVYFAEAKYFIAINDHKTALLKLSALIAQSPEFSESYIEYAKVLELTGKNSFNFLLDASKKLKMSPLNFGFYYQLAIQFQSLKKYPEAISIFKELLKFNQVKPYFYTSYAFTLELNQNFDAAENIYSKGIQKFSTDLHLNFTYCVYLHKHSDESFAEAQYQKMIQQFPNFAPPYLGLSLIAYERLQFEKAIDFAVKAIERDPEFDSAYSQIAHCYHMLESLAVHNKAHYKKALKDFYETARNINNKRIDSHQVKPAADLIGMVNENISKFPLIKNKKIEICSEYESVKDLGNKIQMLYKKINKKNPNRDEQRIINLWKEAKKFEQRKEINRVLAIYNELFQLLISHLKIDLEIKIMDVSAVKDLAVKWQNEQLNKNEKPKLNISELGQDTIDFTHVNLFQSIEFENETADEQLTESQQENLQQNDNTNLIDIPISVPKPIEVVKATKENNSRSPVKTYSYSKTCQQIGLFSVVACGIAVGVIAENYFKPEI